MKLEHKKLEYKQKLNEAKADAVTSIDACLPKKRKVSEAELEEQ